MKSASDIVMKAVGVLLLVAAILKGWQLLTEPMVNEGVWTSRPFSIVQVELELFLGTWLLSGLFKKAAWLVTTMCFVMFSVVTLYKGVTGAESCGCFGSVHVSPWITLLAIDLPAGAAMAMFRPTFLLRQQTTGRTIGHGKPEFIKAFANELLVPIPSKLRLGAVGGFLLFLLTASTAIMALNDPARVNSNYRVLVPDMWVNKQLPIINDIDIGDEQLETGSWLILLHDDGCERCRKAVLAFCQIADRESSGNIDFAVIQIPPVSELNLDSKSVSCGYLPGNREWLVTTPIVILLVDGFVKTVWQEREVNHYWTDISNIVQESPRNIG